MGGYCCTFIGGIERVPCRGDGGGSSVLDGLRKNAVSIVIITHKNVFVAAT